MGQNKYVGAKSKGLDRIGERREPRAKKNYAGIGK
nr:MAG TPA: hypothetical protein [Caudoviricetes sp.]